MHTRTLKCNSWAEILVVFQLSDIITKRILGFENNIQDEVISGIKPYMRGGHFWKWAISRIRYLLRSDNI